MGELVADLATSPSSAIPPSRRTARRSRPRWCRWRRTCPAARRVRPMTTCCRKARRSTTKSSSPCTRTTRCAIASAGCCATCTVAQAWHKAVLANSPFAYKTFADNFGNSPYAQVALEAADAAQGRAADAGDASDRAGAARAEPEAGSISACRRKAPSSSATPLRLFRAASSASRSATSRSSTTPSASATATPASGGGKIVTLPCRTEDATARRTRRSSPCLRRMTGNSVGQHRHQWRQDRHAAGNDGRQGRHPTRT